MITGRFEVKNGRFYLVFDPAEVEAEMMRALEWQIEFDGKKMKYATRYVSLSSFRRFLYRWLGVGLGLDAADRFTKRKVLEVASELSKT